MHTCEPFDPESKGGAEHTVKIAKADLVPTKANLLEEYPSFAELLDACERWCEKVNARPHRAVGVAPAERLATELGRLHVLPEDPHLLALGEERLVGFDQTVSWGNVRYSTPDGHQGAKVWCRVTGDDLVIVARTGTGVAEIARHRLSTPGNPRIVAAHYPHHPDDGSVLRLPKPRPRTAAEIDFLALGEGAHRWLTDAAAGGVVRIRHKMARAVEFAHILGAGRVDQALAVAAAAGRFGDGDLALILDHLAAEQPGPVVVVDETHSTWTRHRRMGPGGRMNSNSAPPLPDELAKICTRDRFGCWAWLDLWRYGPAVPFTRADGAFLAALTAPVTEGLRRAQARTFVADSAPTPIGGPAVVMLSPDLQVRLQTSAATEALYRLNPPDDPIPTVPAAAAYNVAAALVAEEHKVPVGPPWSRVHLGFGRWVTLRAARISPTGAGEGDIAVSIEASTPMERLEVFALAHGVTPRERQVLEQLAMGADSHTVAARLVVSEHTVNDHVKSLLAKTGSTGRNALLTRVAGTG